MVDKANAENAETPAKILGHCFRAVFANLLEKRPELEENIPHYCARITYITPRSYMAAVDFIRFYHEPSLRERLALG